MESHSYGNQAFSCWVIFLDHYRCITEWWLVICFLVLFSPQNMLWRLFISSCHISKHFCQLIKSYQKVAKSGGDFLCLFSIHITYGFQTILPMVSWGRFSVLILSSSMQSMLDNFFWVARNRSLFILLPMWCLIFSASFIAKPVFCNLCCITFLKL